MRDLLRLIRFPNLLVVALTQWLVAVYTIGSALRSEGIDNILDTSTLALIILASCCVAAAGYVINDLLDYSIDLINRPDKVVVNQKISTATVSWLVVILVLIGYVCSLLIALQVQETEWLWLYPVVMILLGWYPRIFKKRPFAGNLLVASCCAGIAGLIWLAERSAWLQLSATVQITVAHVLLLFMGYAFLATWIREVVKDMEDAEGDKALGRETLPIKLGFAAAKKLIYGLSLGLALLLVANSLNTNSAIILLSLTLVVCLLFLTYKLNKAQTSADYRYLSTRWKYYLLGGLLLLFFHQV